MPHSGSVHCASTLHLSQLPLWSISEPAGGVGGPLQVDILQKFKNFKESCYHSRHKVLVLSAKNVLWYT